VVRVRGGHKSSPEAWASGDASALPCFDGDSQCVVCRQRKRVGVATEPPSGTGDQRSVASEQSVGQADGWVRVANRVSEGRGRLVLEEVSRECDTIAPVPLHSQRRIRQGGVEEAYDLVEAG